MVVSTEIDSNIAFVTDKLGVVDNNKGMLPVIPRPTQKRTTTKKPSRNLKSFLKFLTGSQKAIPVKSIITNARKNAKIEPSLVIKEIINGGIIVKLNRESKIPNIRRITASCIVIFLVSLFFYKKVISTWNSDSTLVTCFLSDTIKIT